MNIQTILEATSSTEPSSFSEFCRALGSDCPERGERDEWAELFDCVKAAEILNFIEVERVNGKIDTLILTEAGVARVKELRR